MSWQKRKLDITTFSSTTELDPPAHHAQTWANMTEFLTTRPPTAARKEGLRLLKLARFGDTPNPNGQHSYRWNGNVLHVSGITGDYDAGTVTIDEAKDKLERAGVAAFLYTSPSHLQPGKGHRWRVLAPLSNDLPPDQYAGLVDRLNGALGGILAPESWVLTQPMYYGKVDAEGVVYETRTIRGEPLDLVTGIEPLDKKGLPNRSVATAPANNLNHVPVSAPSAGILTRLERVLAQKDPDCDEPEWWKLGAIVSLETGHSDEGYQLFDAWSSRGSKYQGPEDTARKWEQIGQRGDVANPATIGSLLQETIAADEDFGDTLSDEQKKAAYDVIAEAEAASHAAKLAQFKWTPLEDVLLRPAPDWLVKRVLPEKPINMIFGPSGAGKSFVALDIGLAIARGVPWRGDMRVKPGTVCWFAAEAEGSMRNRAAAYKLAYKLDALPNFHVLGSGVSLLDTPTVRALAEATAPLHPVLFIVDTLAAASGGANENSGEDMGPILDNCQMIHEVTGASVLLIHHSGKDEAKGSRGWSGIKARVDAQLEVRKREDSTLRDIKLDKLRDGDENLEMPFELQVHDIGKDADGDVIASCTVHHLTSNEAPKSVGKRGIPKGPKPATNDIGAMAVLNKLQPVDGEPVIKQDDFLREYAAGMPENQRGDRYTLALSKMRQLVERGIIELDNARGTIFVKLHQRPAVLDIEHVPPVGAPSLDEETI